MRNLTGLERNANHGTRIIAGESASALPLTLSSYQRRARQTDQRRSIDADLVFPLLGLFGETGSLLSEVKKKQRDPVTYIGYQESVVEEFGDVLWYLAVLADQARISLCEIAIDLSTCDTELIDTGLEALTFQTLDGATGGPASSPSPAFERALLRLSAQVGLLMADHSSGRLEQDRAVLKDHLTIIFRTLRQSAHEAGITMEEAARMNLQKIFDRWPIHRTPPPLFDHDFPVEEQLPRFIEADISEIEVNGRNMVRLTRGGRPFGDLLTDNCTEEDDYRFHDVFHLAYAAHLGWSPMLRRMLGVKRKSDPSVDENQDGARAILIEEGITTWIFNHASRLDLFSEMTSLDYGLLKSIRRFVSGYEAEACPLWLWEEAILQGYEIFRSVCKHRGGRVIADLNDRSIRFESP